MQVVVEILRLTSQAAATAVEAAVAKAREIGVAINVAVVDEGGNLLAFRRDDGAFLPSGQIAQDKAWTAVGFKSSTGAFYDALVPEPAVLAGITGQRRVSAFPGGLPVVAEGQIIGGIGVSGASADEDEQCARAGVEAIGLTTS